MESVIKIAIAVCIGIGILIFIAVYWKSLFKKPVYTTEQMEPSIGNKQAELVLFTVDWCPHCKTAGPEWDQLVSQYEGRKMNGYELLFRKINCTTETAEIDALVKQYKVEGFPTVKPLKGDMVIDYDAKPTKSILLQFLKTALNA